MNPILIVDDEKDNLEALQRLLRSHFKVTATTSPLDALKLIQKEEFAVIVSDQRMPEMTGVEFLEKAKVVAPSATRILLTGYTDIDSVIGAINRGNIYRYIAKPWDPEDLKLTLKQAEEASLLRKELERKNQELSQSLVQLKTLDQAKARFVSLISHELNTPLTILNSYLSLLNEKKLSFTGEDQKAVAAISGATDRLSQIVNEIISFVRLETDRTLTFTDFDFEEEATKIAKEFSKEQAAKKLKIKFSFKDRFSLKCDREKMKLGIRRVLQEAINASPAGEEIEVGQEIKNNAHWFWIKRQGEPLSKEALSPFEAGGNILHHQRSLGLGLAMGKLVVEGHGGEIVLESTKESGTKIIFLFPGQG